MVHLVVFEVNERLIGRVSTQGDGPSKFEQFLENHQMKFIVLAILIALGVVGYVIWDGL